MPRNDSWWKYNKKKLRTAPLTLKGKHRRAVRAAINETCRIRKWSCYALNVRSNHVHAVVAARNKKPELILGAFKANATRELREGGLWPHSFSPWADGGSKRRLWNEQSISQAIDYVLYGQGDDLPDFDD